MNSASELIQASEYMLGNVNSQQTPPYFHTHIILLKKRKIVELAALAVPRIINRNYTTKNKLTFSKIQFMILIVSMITFFRGGIFNETQKYNRF